MLGAVIVNDHVCQPHELWYLALYPVLQDIDKFVKCQILTFPTLVKLVSVVDC